MNYNYEERRYMIVMSVVISLLILSIVGVSLLLFLPRTPSNRPNTVNVGSRIARGGGVKAPGGIIDSDLAGSGTESDPYLIKTQQDLFGLSYRAKHGETFTGKYIKLDADIEMDGDASTFNPISGFSGNFDGGGHTIDNMFNRLFGTISPANSTATASITIKNLNINYRPDRSFEGGDIFGSISSNYSAAVTIDNVHINAPNCIARCTNVLTKAVKNYSAFCTVYKDGFTTFNNCSIRGVTMEVYGSSLNSDRTQYMSGFVGVEYKYICNPRLTMTNCYADTDIKVTANLSNSVYVAGFTAFCSDGYLTIDSCVYDGDIYTTSAKVQGVYLFSMNTKSLYSKSISNILVQGNAYVENNSNYNTVYCGIVGSNIVVNSTIDTKSPSGITTYSPFSGAESSWPNCVFNRDKITNRNTSVTIANYGATSDVNMKLRSTYADWTDFDEKWIVNPNINNGYPMLRKFIPVAQVTGFEGSGTEADPYLIKTQQDLFGMTNYYNDNVKFGQNNIYWQLVNDIDVSRDANNMLIHFTPICYDKEFDGYFDGNGKTISGLLIDNQYAYTGLFGTIGVNHYVKDLTVTGNIYWDQAYAVGGVAGRVITGGYLQNCTFNGNIIGVLNTKTSTECHGVVGNYGIGGAIDCSATYKDIKYAKMGGTANSPTYTYYLYDWAQINTNLYDRKVS